MAAREESQDVERVERGAETRTRQESERAVTPRPPAELKRLGAARAKRAIGRMDPELPTRLRARRAEIEDALLARVYSVADPADVEDPEYVRGLRKVVSVALEHAIVVLESASGTPAQLPPGLGAQARMAARNSVGLDTVLRRYFTGHALLCDYILQEAGDAPAHALRAALRAEGSLLDRMLAEVSSAYEEELSRGTRTTEQRRTDLVKRLLAGDPADTAELGYDLELWHVGAVAAGPGTGRALRGLAAVLDRRLLMVSPGGGEVWAWFGGHRRHAVERIVKRARAQLSPGLTLTLGEPGHGISGWRLTHRQARHALPVARRGDERVTAYSEVALLASVLGNEVLADTLRRLYLDPLEVEPDGGLTLRETLCAYFASGRSVSSAAAALGVSRQTATARLQTAEALIGRPLGSCADDAKAALDLWALERVLPGQ